MPSARILFWNGRKLRIGRDSSLECVANHPQRKLVSRQHARIDPSPSCFAMIRDLNSKNGTFVNGTRISKPTQIIHGDHIQLSPLGPAFIFVAIEPLANGPKQDHIDTLHHSMPTTSVDALDSASALPKLPLESNPSRVHRSASPNSLSSRDAHHQLAELDSIQPTSSDRLADRPHTGMTGMDCPEDRANPGSDDLSQSLTPTPALDRSSLTRSRIPTLARLGVWGSGKLLLFSIAYQSSHRLSLFLASRALAIAMLSLL